jgi:hypothetical protein
VLNAHRVTSMADSNIDAVRTDTRKNDTHSSNTCNMYISDPSHIHDPVFSSLNVEGTRLLFFGALRKQFTNWTITLQLRDGAVG